MPEKIVFLTLLYLFKKRNRSVYVILMTTCSAKSTTACVFCHRILMHNNNNYSF